LRAMSLARLCKAHRRMTAPNVANLVEGQVRGSGSRQHFGRLVGRLAGPRGDDVAPSRQPGLRQIHGPAGPRRETGPVLPLQVLETLEEAAVRRDGARVRILRGVLDGDDMVRNG